MIQRKSSIAIVLTAALVSVVTLLLIVFATVYYRAEKAQQEAQLQQDLQFSVQQQAAALTLPMWDLDETHVLEIMRSGLQNRNVVGIAASTQDRHYALARNEQWQVIAVPQVTEDPHFLSATSVIEHEGQQLGVVRVLMTPRFMEENLQTRRTSLMLFIVLLDVTLVVSLSYLLWFLLVKPVQAIERFAASVGQGKAPEPADDPPLFVGELASLDGSIRNMTAMLDSRYQQLNDSQERLTLATRAASIGIWEWDIAQNKLVWDREMHHQYGITPEGFDGAFETWLKTVAPEERDRAAAEISAMLKGKRDVTLDFSIVRPDDGRRRHFRSVAIILRNVQGQATRMVGVSLDITERHEVEHQIRQLNAELESRVKERTAQLEAANVELASARDAAEAATQSKGEFLANMSHEIRTPMNAIVGLTSLALRTELNPKQRNYLSNIKSAAGSLLVIINDILDFSKMEAGKLQMESGEFVLDDVLDKLISVVALKAQEKGLDFLLDVEPALWGTSLMGDPLRLGQVLINLCNNAVKFTHTGEVVVVIREEACPRPNHRRLQIQVRDTGIGMSPDQIGQLFAPFSQLDASTTRLYGGTGLGLSICKQLANLMHGDIQVDSKLGKGSQFTFTADFAKAASPITVTPLANQAKPLHVLVISEGQHVREILGQQLHTLGHTCDLVALASEGLALLSQRRTADSPPGYDVALIDGRLKGSDCFELAHTIRAQQTPPPGIVVLTTLLDESTALRTSREGWGGTLTLPPLPATLNEALKSASQSGSTDTSPASPPAGAPRTPATSLSNRRVLLVEDNPINQIVATDLLSEAAGMQVTVAEDGQQALMCLQNDSFDIILMDVQMPVMDGIQATQQIRRNPALQNVPIIAMTAHAMVRDQQRCLAAGMNDYVTKPFEPDWLFAVLEKWLTPLPPAAPPASSAPVADTADIVLPANVVDFELGLRRCAQRAELYRKLATRFMASRREDTADIRSALHRGDLESAAMIAHQQISTAGVLGADSLSQAARALQMSILEGSATDWPVLLDVFDQQLGAVTQALEHHFDDTP